MMLWVGGCATPDQGRFHVVHQWEGQSAQSVQERFGPPVQILEDGQGGTMLLYGPGTKTYSLADFQQVSYFRRKDLTHIFWVNPQGKVYRVWTATTGQP